VSPLQLSLSDTHARFRLPWPERLQDALLAECCTRLPCLQEVRENADRKENDKNSEWAKPKNNNPLEKTGAAHGITAGGMHLGHSDLGRIDAKQLWSAACLFSHWAVW